MRITRHCRVVSNNYGVCLGCAAHAQRATRSASGGPHAGPELPECRGRRKRRERARTVCMCSTLSVPPCVCAAPRLTLSTYAVTRAFAVAICSFTSSTSREKSDICVAHQPKSRCSQRCQPPATVCSDIHVRGFPSISWTTLSKTSLAHSCAALSCPSRGCMTAAQHSSCVLRSSFRRACQDHFVPGGFQAPFSPTLTNKLRLQSPSQNKLKLRSDSVARFSPEALRVQATTDRNACSWLDGPMRVRTLAAGNVPLRWPCTCTRRAPRS